MFCMLMLSSRMLVISVVSECVLVVISVNVLSMVVVNRLVVVLLWL